MRASITGLLVRVAWALAALTAAQAPARAASNFPPKIGPISGDASCSFVVSAGGNASCTLTLGSSGATAGSYGSASAIPVVTVDAKGRVTGISATPAAFPVTSVAGRGGAVTLAVGDVAGAAPLASPALTGTPTAPTAAAGAASTQVATTAYADRAAQANFSRTPVADASYTALSSDRLIAYTSLTAARTVTLPAASAYPVGTALVVVDESGSASGTVSVTLARSGSDTVNGGSGVVLARPYGYVVLVSNGSARWTVVDTVSAVLTIAGQSPGPDGALTAAQFVQAINAAAPLLPTALPSTSGVVWNNGGIISISQ